MVKFLFNIVLILSAAIVVNFPVLAEDLFTASDKDTSIQVELFEFGKP